MPKPESSPAKYISVAIEKAPAVLGLHQVNETSYVIGKTRIAVAADGLHITLLGGDGGQDTEFTSTSYELNTADGTFILSLENGRLVIKQEVSVTSTWHVYDQAQDT